MDLEERFLAEAMKRKRRTLTMESALRTSTTLLVFIMAVMIRVGGWVLAAWIALLLLRWLGADI